VRDSTEISFTVPWMSNMMWEQVNVPVFHIYILVLNELQAPSTVSDEVDILTFASFGDDYRVAIPYRIPITGFHVATRTVDSKERSIAMSSNLVPVRTDEDYKTDLDTVAELSCIGESVISTRQLIKRFSKDEMSFTFVENVAGASANVHTGTPSTMLILGLRPTLLGSIGRIFRFWSGSIRNKILCGTGANSSISYTGLPGSSEFVQNTTLNPVIEFTTPYYSQTRKSVVGYNPRNERNGVVISFLDESTGAGKTATTTIQKTYQAAGDDFNYHFLIGPPVVNWT